MSKGKKWNLVLLSVVTLVGLLLVGPGTALHAQGPTKGGVLKVGLVGDVGAVDPAFSYDFTTGAVVPQITEGLLRFDQEMKLEPALAESWENPDSLTYIYHLRPGVKFSDGTPMTIDDVVFSMERIRNPETASQLGWVYANVDTITKVDEDTVEVKLAKPDALWQYGVATSAAHVISQKYFEANKEKFGKPDGPPVGTGPFMVAEWQPGTEIVLEPNPYYWDSANGPWLDQVVYKVLPEATARTVALKTGDIDITLGPDSIAIDQFSIVEALPNVTLHKNIGFQVDYVVFNCQREPFTDPKVRQAFYYALDVQSIVNEIVKDGGVPGKPTMITPSMWIFEEEKFKKAFDALPTYEHNLDKARELLSQTAVPDGFKATLVTDNAPIRVSVALAIQSAVKPLGIDLKVEQVTWQEMINRLQNTLDYDMSMDIWASDFPDPAGNIYPTHISTNIGSGGANQSAYVNEEVDKLLNAQNNSTDPSERADLMIQAQAIIAEEVPEIIIDYPYLTMAINNNFTGYMVTPMWFWQSWTRSVYQVK